MVTSGGWPITKLKFNIQKRECKEPAFVVRDLNEISNNLVCYEELAPVENEPLTKEQILKNELKKIEEKIAEMESEVTF